MVLCYSYIRTGARKQPQHPLDENDQEEAKKLIDEIDAELVTFNEKQDKREIKSFLIM